MGYMCYNYVSDHSTDKALNLRMTKRYLSEEVYLFAVRKSQGFFQTLDCSVDKTG